MVDTSCGHTLDRCEQNTVTSKTMSKRILGIATAAETFQMALKSRLVTLIIKDNKTSTPKLGSP